jgi:hypothetical protein
MSVLDTIERILSTRVIRDQFAYFRSVPPNRLAMVAAAAFCVCTAAGLVGALVDPTMTHLASGLCLGGLFGFSAALCVVVLSRKPVWLPVALVLQILLTFVVTRLMLWIDRIEAPAPFASVVQLYCTLALLFMLGGYGLFFWFILAEGRFAFRAQTELALAQSIQQTLVPIVDLAIVGSEIYGVSVPSEKVGGDLVDVVSLPDGSAVAYLADIAGHGLSAGILMGMFKAAARACLMEATEPEELFENLNRVIPAVKEAYMYATCAAFRLRSRPSGGCDIQFSLAGQPPILHLSAGGQPRPRVERRAVPLRPAAMDRLPEPIYLR